MNTRTTRRACALAAVAVLPAFGSPATASPLSNCYDRVISACNKKSSDAAVNACVKSGLDQCDGQFKASGGSSQGGTVRPEATRTFRAN